MRGIVCSPSPPPFGSSARSAPQRPVQDGTTKFWRTCAPTSAGGSASFWDAGIRGPDFVWAATGPALEAYSKHPVVKMANDPGQTLTVVGVPESRPADGRGFRRRPGAGRRRRGRKQRWIGSTKRQPTTCSTATTSVSTKPPSGRASFTRRRAACRITSCRAIGTFWPGPGGDDGGDRRRRKMPRAKTNRAEETGAAAKSS